MGIYILSSMPKKTQKEAPVKKAAAAPAPAERTIPENIIKKQERDEKLMKAKKTAMAKAKTDRKASRTLALANAEKYHKEYAAADQALIDEREKPRRKESSSLNLRPRLLSLSELRVSTSLPPSQRRSCSFLDLDNCTTVCSSS